jgi:hypothetical protein
MSTPATQRPLLEYRTRSTPGGRMLVDVYRDGQRIAVSRKAYASAEEGMTEMSNALDALKNVHQVMQVIKK